MVVSLGVPSRSYAGQLVAIADEFSSSSAFSQYSLSMTAPNRLEGRLVAVLDSTRDRSAVTSREKLRIVPLACICAVLLALVQGRLPPHSESHARSPIAASSKADDASDPVELVRIGYVDDTAEASRSLGGSGHAVRFQRPSDTKFLMSVEIFAGRYGASEPPAEDFHLYILDTRQNVLRAYPFPYAAIERGNLRWHTLRIPAVEVPEEFFVGLSFSPHRTKGIYLGLDSSNTQPYSFVGRPTVGYRRGDPANWMVRLVLAEVASISDPFRLTSQPIETEAVD
jgi:hypothetical protein